MKQGMLNIRSHCDCQQTKNYKRVWLPRRRWWITWPHDGRPRQVCSSSSFNIDHVRWGMFPHSFADVEDKSTSHLGWTYVSSLSVVSVLVDAELGVTGLSCITWLTQHKHQFITVHKLTLYRRLHESSDYTTWCPLKLEADFVSSQHVQFLHLPLRNASILEVNNLIHRVVTLHGQTAGSRGVLPLLQHQASTKH